MKRRTFLTFVSLSSLASTIPLLFNRNSLARVEKNRNQVNIEQNPTLSTDFVNVRDLGPLISGITNNSSIIAANTTTIQTAIDIVGKNGGGNIYIPTGLYQVAPPNLTVQIPSAIVINYDKITLFGDGIGKTIIQSRGDWSVIQGQVIRGIGILIKGSNNARKPRRDIIIKNLELSGSTNGFTGNRDWPADTFSGDGWDISHKGIVLDFNRYLDNITIDSVYVHDFKGELIYGGGLGIGKVKISNTKLHNSNASMLSLEADLTVTHCEFSQTANAWVENAPISPNRTAYFNKCLFKNSTVNGLVLAQGKFPNGYKQFITNCSFYNSPAGVCILGGVSNISIKGNIFIDCKNTLLISGKNSNIEFIENEVKGEKEAVILAKIFGQLSNATINLNNHKNEKLNSLACVFYFGNLQNVVIEKNRFENCRTPEQLAALSNERPLFRNNQYINVERRDSQGTRIFSRSLPYMIEPKFEEIVVINNTDNPIIEVGISTDYYVEGQEVLIIAGTSKWPIKLPKSSSTVQCQSDRYLSDKGERLRLRFKKTDRKWHEVSYSSA